MARSYFSTAFDQPVDEVWALVRDFNAYSLWVDGAGESYIEDGKSGDTVGAVRNVQYDGRTIRQRLLAHSDRDRYLTYQLCEPHAYPVRNFEATQRFTPIIDRNQTFGEWWATFDAGDEQERWIDFYRDSFEKWFNSLRKVLAKQDRDPVR